MLTPEFHSRQAPRQESKDATVHRQSRALRRLTLLKEQIEDTPGALGSLLVSPWAFPGGFRCL